MPKRGLGKGLDALFNDIPTNQDNSNLVTALKITEVEPNKEQPRKYFDEEQLIALSESIKEHGIIQPIIVSRLNTGFYQIIAGERRWRAARLAGLKTIPCIIRDYDKQEIMEVALIENLQREDLNAIEEAEGYKNLMENFDMTQERISERVGKSRSAVANSLRLLSLDSQIKQLLVEGKLTSGHARALLSIEDNDKRQMLAEKIVSQGLSVREAEAQAKEKPKKEIQEKIPKSFDIIELEKALSEKLGTKVIINQGKSKGKIEVEYYDEEQLERLIDIINTK